MRRTKPRAKRRFLTVPVTPQFYADVKRRAARDARSVAGWVRQVLREEMERR